MIGLKPLLLIMHFQLDVFNDIDDNMYIVYRIDFICFNPCTFVSNCGYIYIWKIYQVLVWFVYIDNLAVNIHIFDGWMISVRFAIKRSGFPS